MDPQQESSHSTNLEEKSSTKDDDLSSCQSSDDSNVEETLSSQNNESLVEFYGTYSSRCGYCKQKSGSRNDRTTYDMQTSRLTAADYQRLLDTGWRRSGKYCYYPMNHNTCCPNYSIVCEATRFNLSRTQRKVIENLNSFLAYGRDGKRLTLKYPSTSKQDASVSSMIAAARNLEELKQSSKLRHRRFHAACERKMKLYNLTADEAMKQIIEKKYKRVTKKPVIEDYLFPQKESMHSSDRSDFAPKHNLRMRMHHVNSEESQNLRRDEYNLMLKYQQAVHHESSREWTLSRYKDFLVESPLIIEPLRCYNYLDTEQCDDDKKENDKIGFIHRGEPLSKMPKDRDIDKYLLVKPPEFPTAHGTYHCCYYLDDVLIAVGVIDVLPKCLTSVYFFYDPEYSFLNLGNYSAMVEISMVRQIAEQFSGGSGDRIDRYYLGYYVHECEKMRYKTRFRPSYLLCSLTHQYVPTEVSLGKLKGTKYAVFSDDKAAIDSALNKLDAVDIHEFLQIRVATPVTGDDAKISDYLAWLSSNLGSEYADLLFKSYLTPYAALIDPSLLAKLRLKLDAVHTVLVDKHRRTTAQRSSESIVM